jgi:hypothetical protein
VVKNEWSFSLTPDIRLRFFLGAVFCNTDILTFTKQGMTVLGVGSSYWGGAGWGGRLK